MAKKYLTISIDVEPDCSKTWHYSSPLTFNGVTVGISEILQPLFNKHGACPSYLINNVVLEDARSIETFRNLKGNFELGTHLHCEFIEPERQFKEYAGKKGEANQCFLEPEIEFEKLKNITNLFVSKFDRQPTSFRAGRFSAGENTIDALTLLGYKVDTSVTPHVNWNDASRERPIDYRSASEQPYFIKKGSYLQRDDCGSILEVPVTILKARKFGVLNRPIWLRPFMTDFDGFMRVMRAYGRKYEMNRFVIYNMMFHNVEVLPGMSPYPQTKEEARLYIQSLDALLAYCSKNDILCVGLSELYDILR